MLEQPHPIKQSALMSPDPLHSLLSEWAKTHLYDPESLGELLQEVVE